MDDFGGILFDFFLISFGNSALGMLVNYFWQKDERNQMKPLVAHDMPV